MLGSVSGWHVVVIVPVATNGRRSTQPEVSASTTWSGHVPLLVRANPRRYRTRTASRYSAMRPIASVSTPVVGSVTNRR